MIDEIKVVFRVNDPLKIKNIREVKYFSKNSTDEEIEEQFKHWVISKFKDRCTWNHYGIPKQNKLNI